MLSIDFRLRAILPLVFLLSIFNIFISCDCSDSLSADQTNLDKNIELVATSTHRWTGLAISSSGRLFVNYPNCSTDHNISVAELINNNSESRPFPDAEWNDWQQGKNAASHFVAVQSVVIDSNNFLWILDAGNPQRDGVFRGIVPGAAKLIKADLNSNSIIQTILLDDAVKENSYLNDVRINETLNEAYITDSNVGALVIVNLQTGKGRRVLENHSSTKSENKILTVEGKPFRNAHGEYPVVHIDGIAISNDRSHLYWRSLTGEKLYSIDVASLHDISLNEEALASRVKTLGSFPPSDGMIVGYYNELFLASIEENAIRAYDNGNDTRLIRQRNDFRWPDSFSLGNDGYLYFTTSQVHLVNPTDPYKIFKFQVKF